MKRFLQLTGQVVLVSGVLYIVLNVWWAFADYSPCYSLKSSTTILNIILIGFMLSATYNYIKNNG